MLHVTNGDAAGGVLQRAIAAGRIAPGQVLPWRDVLHEGPVRSRLVLGELSTERARFIAEAGWGALPDVLKEFQARDAALGAAGRHDEVVLWFEHDLYDQLQLIQVLDRLAELRGPPISLVCEAEYLGTIGLDRAAELFSLRSPLTRRHFQEAQRAWRAFGGADPRAIEPEHPKALRFLGAALRRHLEEFPWTTDGLSRLERNVVEALRGGPLSFADLFSRVQEEPRFLGDAVLEWHLRRMETEGLLAGKRKLRLPRWLGGYEVRDESLRWDPGSGRLVA